MPMNGRVAEAEWKFKVITGSESDCGERTAFVTNYLDYFLAQRIGDIVDRPSLSARLARLPHRHVKRPRRIVRKISRVSRASSDTA